MIPILTDDGIRLLRIIALSQWHILVDDGGETFSINPHKLVCGIAHPSDVHFCGDTPNHLTQCKAA